MRQLSQQRDSLHGDDTALEILQRTLRHPRQEELAVRLAEVVQHRPYLQHGIELRPGEVVIDAGANIGVSSAFFAVECKAGVVHSLEPIAPIYAYLVENLRSFPACVPHNYGLGSRPGMVEMTYYPEVCEISGSHVDPVRDEGRLRTVLRNLGGSEEQIDDGLRDRFSAEVVTAQVLTLSDVFRRESIDRVDLLKLDVEGDELEVLQGIEDGDWPVIRQIVGELHLDPAESERFVALLGSRGFAVSLTQEPGMKGTPFRLFHALRRRV